jgi:hypothetical protein
MVPPRSRYRTMALYSNIPRRNQLEPPVGRQPDYRSSTIPRRD